MLVDVRERGEVLLGERLRAGGPVGHGCHLSGRMPGLVAGAESRDLSWESLSR